MASATTQPVINGDIDLAVRDIARELSHWVDQLGRDVMTACVRQAVDDLRGSVHAEALREMAVRLATHRLGLLATRSRTRAA